MSRADRFDFTLDEETEKRLYDLLTDMDTRNTNRFWITDKRGYHAEYAKVIRCKDCKHQRKEYREDKRRKDGGYNIYWCDLVDGYAPLGFDDEYCAWAERKEE